MPTRQRKRTTKRQVAKRRPARKTPARRPARRQPQSGDGFLDSLKKVNKFLRDEKIISKGLAISSLVGGPAPATVAGIARIAGYGNCGCSKGKGVKLAGQGTALAGQGRRPRRKPVTKKRPGRKRVAKKKAAPKKKKR